MLPPAKNGTGKEYLRLVQPAMPRGMGGNGRRLDPGDLESTIQTAASPAYQRRRTSRI